MLQSRRRAYDHSHNLNYFTPCNSGKHVEEEILMKVSVGHVSANQLDKEITVTPGPSATALFSSCWLSFNVKSSNRVLPSQADTISY